MKFMENNIFDTNISIYILKHSLKYCGKRKKKEEKRIDPADGNFYTKQDFLNFYSHEIGTKWKQAGPSSIPVTNDPNLTKILNRAINKNSYKIETEEEEEEEFKAIYIYIDDKYLKDIEIKKNVKVNTILGTFTPDIDTDALRRWKKAKLGSEFIGCFCGEEYFTDDWVECDSCERWCHLKCTYFKSKEDAKLSESYICPMCSKD